MLKSYGGYVWTAEEPYQPESEIGFGTKALALGAIGSAGLYAASRTMQNGYRPLDYLAASARLGAHLSPFQIASTFRLPEILSPLLSNQYRFGNTDPVSWSRDLLSSPSTYEWLKYSTGLNDQGLRSAGVTPGMLGSAAQSLEWTSESATRGRLETVFATGERRLLSRDISLLARNEEVNNVLTGRRSINRFAAGVFAAADMYRSPLFEENEVFARRLGSGATEAAAYIPMPSLRGAVTSAAELNRRTTWLRGIPAFEMGRFGHLIQNVSEQFLGDRGKTLTSALGIGSNIRPGPASAMFARYGLLAAGAGAAIIGNSQLDWFRRQDASGQVLAAGVTSAAASYAASRLGATSKTALTVGLAGFFGQMIMPGFDQGIMEGIATAGVNLDITRASSLNPFNYYRRTMEGFLPGVSSFETGALLGIGVLAATSMKLPGMRERLNVKALRDPRVRSALGVPDNISQEIAQQNRSVRDIFFQRLGRDMNMADTHGTARRARMLYQYHANAADRISATKNLNGFWALAEEDVRTLRSNNPLNEILLERLRGISTQHSGRGFDRVMREGKGMLAELSLNFAGADLASNRALVTQARDLGFSGVGRLGRFAGLALAAIGAQQVLTGGLLGSMQSASELQDIYSGKQLVEMKKGRAWEGGGTPFEGGETQYYRPHQYALMMNRVREKGVWGENEDEISPIGKFIKKNFTYDLERQNYYNRPYPVSSAAFEDIPIIGSFLGASIGQLIKPSKLMHTSEWVRENQGNIEFANVFKGNMMEPAYELGAIGQGKPISKFAASSLYETYTDQFRQLEGLTGFAKNALSDSILGSKTWSNEQARLATSGEMTSWNNQFWEMELGGGLFTTELIRRIFPKKPHEQQSYNPIMNSMPSWLPDRFKYGDPYRQMPWGEARLPGAGFAAMHPELRGVDPENYPLLYQYKILSDVAPLTPEFFMAQQQIFKQRQAGAFTSDQEAYLDQVDKIHARVVNKINISEDPNAIRLPGSGVSRTLWESSMSLARHVVAPAEYLIPPPLAIRPFQKLTGQHRDIIEQYENERLYGSKLSFWDEPVRDWLRPSFYSAMHLLGYDGKPIWRQEADATNAYFDKLEFIKYMNLAEQASQSGDSKAAAQFRWQASQTRHGVNPQGSPLSIYWALPSEERAYFNSFSQVTNNSDRKRILEMVPADQQHLYKAVWSRLDSGDANIYATSSVIDKQYMQSRYGEAYRDVSQIVMPEPDWIGFKDGIDQSDIQVRYLDSIGADVHDYGLWESDLRKSQGQPFLDNVEAPFRQGVGLRFSAMRSEVYNMLGNQFSPPSLNYSSFPGATPYTHIQYNDNRNNELANLVERAINAY